MHRAVPGAVALLVWLPAVARADPPRFTSGPAIQGQAVVGSTLRVVATWAGDPLPSVKYRWGRCPARKTSCKVIGGADEDEYVVASADVGYSLVAEVTLKSKGDRVTAIAPATATVVAAAPTPVPSPAPSPGLPPPAPASAPPAPAPAPPAPASSPPVTLPVSAPPQPPRAAPMTFLRPFPVVRIRGYFAPAGARVTLLSVRAPRSASITARCVGRHCPIRTRSFGAPPLRLHVFERFLRAGTLLQIRVVRAGRIGKYVSFLIRARRAPLRTDRCLVPGRRAPVRCEAT